MGRDAFQRFASTDAKYYTLELVHKQSEINGSWGEDLFINYAGMKKENLLLIVAALDGTLGS